jgi:hypothetical protein
VTNMPSTTTIAAFWLWLHAHQAALREMSSPRDAFWDELLPRLKTVHEDLWFEVSVPGKTVREFVITAQGDTSLFPLVEELASQAPEIPGWTVVALKPPMGFGFSIKYEGVELKPDDIWFEPHTSKDTPNVLGLRIAAPGYVEELDQEFCNGVLILLLVSGPQQPIST